MLTPGADVLAPWLGEGNLYPAVIVTIDGDAARVAYWEGDFAEVRASELVPIRYAIGDRVQANSKNRGKYLAGVICQRIGGAVLIEYADGSREWTTWAKCRVPLAWLSAEAPS